ncbi:MAG: uracil-DNA glycosylase family protein [Variovorax sp.]
MSAGTLKLDARQRAMLDEMGVKVWLPTGEVAPPSQVPAVPAVPAVRAAAPAPAAPPVSAPAQAQAPASMVPVQGAGVLVEAPRRIFGAGDIEQGGWLIVADMPPEPDGRHGDPFAGDAGRLLGNMLRALKLHDAPTPVHLMRTHRGVASGQPSSPRPFEEAFAAPAAALAPRIVLAMGPLAAQAVLQSGEPLGRLRGRATRLSAFAGLQRVPAVATYHPAYLLRNAADKARAWSDLCLAAEQFLESDA